MMVFSLILLAPADWDLLERRFGGSVERMRRKLGPALTWLAARTAAVIERPPLAAAKRLRELTVAALMMLALSQIAVENEAVPKLLRLPQPDFMSAAISYLRLNQGWGMFAPDAPREDMMLVVDAVTVDGRHIDPYNLRASVVADPGLRELPQRLGQNYFYCDYTSRIEDAGLFHEPLREWILAHYRRTKRAEDKIVSFTAYIVEHTSPKPGEAGPTGGKARKLMSGRASD